ncbi:MAG: adenosine deaminase [Planctomycetes bacterium]|nr:adenosine deaminase [Planctomycetota bacterium]
MAGLTDRFAKHKDSADQETPDADWIRRLPKTDLHVHLGGSMRFETLLDEAARQGVELPPTEELRRSVILDGPGRDLSGYLGAFQYTESILRDATALRRVARELVEDAAAENVRVLEVRFGPTNYVTGSLRLYEVVEAVLEGLQEGGSRHGVRTGLIVCGIRTDMEATSRAAQIAVNYMDHGVVGFDLAGKERGFPPKDFREVFHIIHDNFLPVTVHAGESFGAKSIADAINHLNARRIGHGVHLRENEKLYDYVDIYRIGLEVCVSSNVHSGASHLATHPVRKYFQDGLRVSINTDNRLVSNTTVTRELELLAGHMGFNKGDLKILVKNGVKSAFLKTYEVKRILDSFDEEFGKLP